MRVRNYWCSTSPEHTTHLHNYTSFSGSISTTQLQLFGVDW